MQHADRIFVALDLADRKAASALAKRLNGHVGGFKLGLEYFSANGPDGVRAVTDAGLKVFLDLKFHDIPNTVAGAVRSVVATGPAIINVHASGGKAMMRAAVEAAEESALENKVDMPVVTAVTVLTSLDGRDLKAVGQNTPAHDQVLRLARLAKQAGLGGVVCSAGEAAAVRTALGQDFLRIVPGIRPAWAASNDQKRVTTPKQALRNGADILVIGRPITQAKDPADAVRRIAEEMAEAS